jgi:hypothetical protein
MNMALADPQMVVVLSAIISWKEVSDKRALRNADELLSEFTAACRATLELRLISLIGHVTILQCVLIAVRTKKTDTLKNNTTKNI